MPQCNICQEYLDTWPKLAKHVLEHDAHNKWALAFLSKAQLLNQKRDLPQRTTLTEEQREAKEDCQRELSGMLKAVLVQCPICTTPFQARLEQEFVSNPQAWRDRNTLLVLCDSCRR